MQFLDKDGKKLSDSLNKDILNRKTEKPSYNGGNIVISLFQFNDRQFPMFVDLPLSPQFLDTQRRQV